LKSESPEAACYEASVRGSSTGALRAGRMMIERASTAILEAIAAALDVDLPAVTKQWLDLARRERVYVIVGWDLRTGGHDRCVKVYVNASDASRETRARLRRALLPRVGADGEPAVLGMNVRADGVLETKAYLQSADAVALSRGLDARAGRLAAAAEAEGASAGGVLSYDADDGVLRPRAFFIALREPREKTGWQCVRSLPGYDEGAVEALLPFAPAPPRSVGVSLDDDAWTLYCKPRASGRAPQALEPAAIFRLDGAEIGVFVEPTEHAARAFRRTARHAVSIRVRNGEPTPRELESLVDWFTAELGAAEHEGVDFRAHLANPPAPWRLVEPVLPTPEKERLP